MKRKDIRQLKRAVLLEKDPAAMGVLLRRSILLGHKRLALLRCLQAEQMGIEIEHDVLAYCQSVADELSPEELERLIRQVGRAAGMSWPP